MPRGVTSAGTFTPVQVTLAGRQYNGHWFMRGDVLHIQSAYGSPFEKLGRRKPQRLAEELFMGVVRAWEPGGEKP